MRYRGYVRVPGEEPERVLRALEQRLRAELVAVERTGSRITVVGLGPTWRVNPHNRTVIDVTAGVDGSIVDADVNFHPVILIKHARQEEMMRTKFDAIFGGMKDMLCSEPRPEENCEPAAAVPRNPVRDPDPQLDFRIEDYLRAAERNAPEPAGGSSLNRQVSRPKRMAPRRKVKPLEAGIARAEVHERFMPARSKPAREVRQKTGTDAGPRQIPHLDRWKAPSTEASAGSHVVEFPDLQIAPAMASQASTPQLARMTPFVLSPPPLPAAASTTPTPGRVPPPPEDILETSELLLLHRAREEGADEAGGHIAGMRRWVLWGALAASVAAAASLAVRSWGGFGSSQHLVEDRMPAVSGGAVTAPAAGHMGQVAAGDPSELLRQWETAMRSTDAKVQASFYAVPADQYFDRRHVTQDEIAVDKQFEIDRRREDWALAIEPVRIIRTSDTTATVRLVKHYTGHDTGSAAGERFVLSELKLHKDNGVWWITSERDVRWAASRDRLFTSSPSAP